MTEIAPNRIVYHRGSVIYARFKFGGPEDYRHPLDVPNGLGCGCVCDECDEQLLACANEAEKVEAGLYKKIPYFAHQSNSKCAPGGERGLLESFRLVIDSLKSIHLPAAHFSSGSGQPLDVLYSPATSVEVQSCAVGPKQSGQPHELLLETAQGKIRLLVVTKLPSSSVVEAIKQQPVPTVIANMIPDLGGIIYMRDVLASVKNASALAWISLPEMDVYAAERRKLREAEQERIRVAEEAAQEIRDTQIKEKLRRMDEEAAQAGLVKLLCAACKVETRYGPACGAWERCPECKRATNFWPIKTSVQTQLPTVLTRPRYF